MTQEENSPAHRRDFSVVAHLSQSSWANHWEREICFQLASSLADTLNENDLQLAKTAMKDIECSYKAFEHENWFVLVRAFFEQNCTPSSGNPNAAAWPTAAFGVGFGSVRSVDDASCSRTNTVSQIAAFIGMVRVLRITVTATLMYDPRNTPVDVVVLGSLGLHCYTRETIPATNFSCPTLFYAPGAEQSVSYQPIHKDVRNLLLLCGDVSDCETWTRARDENGYVVDYEDEDDDTSKMVKVDYRDMEEQPRLGPFVDYRRTMRLPESGQLHLLEDLQWIPTRSIDAYTAAADIRQKELCPHPGYLGYQPATITYGTSQEEYFLDDLTGVLIRQLVLGSEEAVMIEETYFKTPSPR